MDLRWAMSPNVFDMVRSERHHPVVNNDNVSFQIANSPALGDFDFAQLSALAAMSPAMPHIAVPVASYARPVSPDGVFFAPRGTRPTGPPLPPTCPTLLSPHTGPTRILKVFDGKVALDLEVGVAEDVAQVRDMALRHRHASARANVVILTERLNGKRLSDTGSFDQSQLFDSTNGLSMAHFPHVQELFVYEICQGQPLRGENGMHTRLCHPKSSMCEAHRKQLERAKIKRPTKDRPDSPDSSVAASEDPKRRKRLQMCEMTLEILVGDVCRLGQDLLNTLTSFTPMRTQLRGLLSAMQMRCDPVSSLALRWPRQWFSDRLLGFEMSQSVITFRRSTQVSMSPVAVRSQMPEFGIDATFAVSLEGRWDCDDSMTMSLLKIQSSVPVRIKIFGAQRGEVLPLNEFTMAIPSTLPLLFASAMIGQKDAHNSLLVLLEDAATGDMVFQQVLKLCSHTEYTQATACEVCLHDCMFLLFLTCLRQWLQLVEFKLANEGAIAQV